MTRTLKILALGLIVAGCGAPPPGAPAWSSPNTTETATLDGAERVARWLGQMGTPANDHRTTELAWQRRDAQAPAVALVHGLAWASLGTALGGRNAIVLINGLAALASILLVVTFLRRRFGWLAAGAGGGLLALAPGFLWQTGTAGPEPILGLALLLVCAGAWCARRRAACGLPGALALALITATHPTGALLILPVYLYEIAVGRRTQTSVAEARPGTFRVPPLPVYPLLGVGLGIVLLVALWPWLGIQTGSRLSEYFLAPHMASHPPFLLFGRAYVQATGSAPPLWTALILWLTRVAPALLALSLVGVVRTIRPSTTDVHGARHPAQDLLLPVLLLATWLGIHTLSGSPWYDGVDNIVVALPLIALLAGAGFAHVIAWTHRRTPTKRWAVPAVVLSLVLAAGGSRFFAGLGDAGYMNVLIGGPRGAAALGITTRPALGLDPPVVHWLNEHLPDHAVLAFLPETERLNRLALRLVENGVLREDFVIATPETARYLVSLPATGYPETTALKDRFADQEALGEVRRRGVRLAVVYTQAGESP